MALPTRIGSTVAAAALILAGGAAVMPAEAHPTGIHDNCTKFNNRFPHGVGTRRAHDRTSGTPVRNFKRSNRIYWRAERHNGDLDRDNDRIACEKA
jgi:Excalibur calcium-binding domain